MYSKPSPSGANLSSLGLQASVLPITLWCVNDVSVTLGLAEIKHGDSAKLKDRQLFCGLNCRSSNCETKEDDERVCTKCFAV